MTMTMIIDASALLTTDCLLAMPFPNYCLLLCSHFSLLSVTYTSVLIFGR